MATCACNNNCTGGCKGGCTNCTGCYGGCTSCTWCGGQGTCFGGCTSGCAWTCSGGCNGCSGDCEGECKGCGSNCAGKCDGSCKDTCNDTCDDTCKTGCTNSCTGLCNAGCESSAMSITLDDYLTSENIQNIADLIIFELARRPDSKAPTDTTGLFIDGKLVTLADITTIVNNLKLTGQSIAAPGADTTVLQTFGQSLIDKLLAANRETINLS